LGTIPVRNKASIMRSAVGHASCGAQCLRMQVSGRGEQHRLCLSFDSKSSRPSDSHNVCGVFMRARARLCTYICMHARLCVCVCVCVCALCKPMEEHIQWSAWYHATRAVTHLARAHAFLCSHPSWNGSCRCWSHHKQTLYRSHQKALG
jgi:hypothetical protein